MSGMVARTLGSGLVVAEEAADEARLSRAVKQIDPAFVLQKHPADVAGGWVYKVFQVVSEDREAVCVLTWTDMFGNPLPLSSGLVDELQKYLPEARSRRGPDADARNRQLAERRQRDMEHTVGEIIADHQARVARGQITVSLSARSKLRYWQKNRSGPASSGVRR